MIDKEKSLAYNFPELAEEWHPFMKRHFILPKTFMVKTISSPLSCTLTS